MTLTRSSRGKVFPRLMFFFIVIALLGCEAPLNLEGVERSLAQPIRRTDVFQTAANNGTATVVMGNHGLVVRSVDKGQTWTRATLKDWPAIIGVAACPNGMFAALSFEKEVWTSDDDGATWTANPIETEEAAQALTCDPNNRIWVVGSFSSIMHSADAGKTWTTFSNDEDIIYTTVQFIDAMNAYVTGEFGAVLRSSDAGETWENLEPLADEFYPQATLFTDLQTGWVIGLGGAIWHTTDGGTSWSLQPAETEVPLYGITQFGGTLYAVGGEGTLVTLKGNKWVVVNHGRPVRFFLRAITGLSDDKLLIAGRAGALFVLELGEITKNLASNDTTTKQETKMGTGG